MSNKSNKEQMNSLLKLYLDNYNKTDENELLELEVKFGTKNKKIISRIDYENVIKTLLSSGFVFSVDEYLLRIVSEKISDKHGEITLSNIRTEINGLGNISEYCKYDKISTETFTIDNKFVKKEPYKTFKENITNVDFQDFNFRIALAHEVTLNDTNDEVMEIINDWDNKKKLFRYLVRHTLTHPNWPIKVDLSIVKQSEKINKRFKTNYSFKDSGVLTSNEHYEIEIEVINDLIGIGTNYDTIDKLNIVIKNAIKIVLCGLQQTNYPISYEEQDSVKNKYMRLILKDDYKPEIWCKNRHFIGPSSVTLQIDNISELTKESNIPNIRNNYTVTDKADGERKLLFISDIGKIYLIDTNMNIQFTGAISSNKNIFNSIIDGEHIKTNKLKEYINLYAAFDIYFINNKDVRKNKLLPLEKDDERMNFRLPKLISVINEMHIKGIVPDAPSPIKVECKSFYSTSDLPSIFSACKKILDKETNSLFSYNTDGLIFTPIDKGVGLENDKGEPKAGKSTWDYSFKWKPPEFNTIDFLVTIKKDPTGNDYISNLFQGGISNTKTSQFKQYKILELRVGFDENRHGFINPYQDMIDDNLPQSQSKSRFNDNYKPVIFYPSSPSDENAGYCNIEINKNSENNDILQTEEGETIEDKMIIEFKYDLNEENPLWRWKPLRIRYDKTADFRNNGNNFGNAYHVANDNWHSIHNPITIDMLSSGLSIPDNSDTEFYYNKVYGESATRGLRDFHNLFVKKHLINSISRRDDTLIDYAVGKAGDLRKWVYAKLKFVFGIDIHKDNIENRFDGACSRYLNTRKKFEIMPSALFIHGNSSSNIRTGDVAFSEKGKQIAKAVFGYGAKDIKELGKAVHKHYSIANKGFNIGSIQFAIHYMFENEKTLFNFLRNVSETIKVNGYFIGTCYDGKEIFKLLNKLKVKEKKTIVENDKKLWEITKKYSINELDDDKSCIGHAIDVYQESINKTFQEYLVNFDYLTRIMENYGFLPLTNEELKHTNLKNSIGNFKELHTLLTNKIKANSNSEKDYGNSLKMTPGERKISFLNKYFIYKKSRDVDAESVTKNLLGNSNLYYEEKEKQLEDLQKYVEVTEDKVNKLNIKPPIKLNRRLKLTMK
tara:strand:+ start:1160 stop:4510 length:3351 start_codon:yes stop_codon:yes gene_type:complete